MWLNSPQMLFLTDALPFRGLVYDCSQEWDDLPLEWESELAAKADVIFAASEELIRRLEPCCDNIALIPNGVNHLLFSQSHTPPPRELAGLRGPVFCRVGEVGQDLDLKPVLSAAIAHPDWNFLFLGRADPEPAQKLMRRTNIYMPGVVSPAEVADYLGACQVCFDLYSLRNRGSDILPCHIYEYLASGKPIVAMVDEEQVEPYPDVIYTAHTPTEFVIRCEHALEEDPGWVSQRRREYGLRASWSARADEIQSILETAGLL